MEGIVAKRRLGIYTDDGNSWLNIKNHGYTQAEEGNELLMRRMKKRRGFCRRASPKPILETLGPPEFYVTTLSTEMIAEDRIQELVNQGVGKDYLTTNEMIPN